MSMTLLARLTRFQKEKLPEYLLFPALMLLAARLLSIMVSPLAGLTGYGDLANYFQLAHLSGWPFINYWVEFPPIFPFLNTFLFNLAGGIEVSYDYLLIFVLLLFDVGNLILFIKIATRMGSLQPDHWRVLTYLIVLVTFSYAWWYFDSMAVFGMLLGLFYIIEGKDLRAGGAIAFGGLVKLFPLALLAIPWCFKSRKKALRITISSLVIVFITYAALFVLSPVYTRASLSSQFNKGSWETVWALIDGNYQTGNFGPYAERVNPETASQITRNSATVNPVWTLIVIGGIGLWIFLKAKRDEPIRIVAFAGISLCLLFIWSPGWSPQWVLFLVPLILLSLPPKQGILTSVTIILINVLEWPILLSRGLFNELWVTVTLRTLVLALLALLWFAQIFQKPTIPPKELQP